jgi:poly(A) polymerase
VSHLDPEQQREFALHVVEKLRAAGHQALFAGGCVRDQLLNRPPKDYDVATSATPPEIRQVFGRRRTLAIGAAFGVIAVVGPKQAGTVEVTTFRRDADYSDGRHPDAVTFSSPEDDARRRDFTINGLFYDPAAARVIDYVDGQRDLEAGVVRAIGDARARFGEDKLRMLRAVRMSATFGFVLETATRAAIEEMAATIPLVSPERIAQEMRVILEHPNRAQAVELLRETRLLDALLPEVNSLRGARPGNVDAQGTDLWQHALGVLARLEQPGFPLALAAVLRHVPAAGAAVANDVCFRWKLSNKEHDRVGWLIAHQDDLRDARAKPFSKLQRLLASDEIEDLLALTEAEALTAGDDLADVAHCRALLALPPGELNPPPLLDGNDLLRHGVRQGPVFARLLDAIRDAQLDGQVCTREEAIGLADRLLAAGF